METIVSILIVEFISSTYKLNAITMVHSKVMKNRIISIIEARAFDNLMKNQIYFE